MMMYVMYVHMIRSSLHGGDASCGWVLAFHDFAPQDLVITDVHM